MKNQILHILPEDFPWRNQIQWYDVIDSTNTKAKVLASQGAPEGTLIIAGCQTGGRGRLGRSFASPKDSGVYMSLILRPNCSPSKLMHLTCAAGVAAADAVETVSGIRPGIKWTNDLVYGRQKLGGILTELSVNPQTGIADFAVIGMGINCRQQPGDFPQEIQSLACSLRMMTGKDISCAVLAAALMVSLYRMNCGLHSQKQEIMARFSRDCVTVGQEISLLRGDEVRHGKAVSVNTDGELLVEFSDGHRESVTSGEVSIRGMYGYL